MTITTPTPEWTLDAACADWPYPDDWFPDTYTGRPSWTEARRICNRCPVRLSCLAHALNLEGDVGPGSRHGMYGGLTPDERARLARTQPTTRR